MGAKMLKKQMEKQALKDKAKAAAIASKAGTNI